jgi:hypothetical protein
MIDTNSRFVRLVLAILAILIVVALIFNVVY